MNYRAELISWFPFLEERWKTVGPYFHYQEVPAKTVLLREGDVATKIYFVLKGSCRLYYIKEDGMEITAQFFFERQMVSSFESFYTGEKSRASIETTEESSLVIVAKNDFLSFIKNDSVVQQYMQGYIFARFITYRNLFASYLLDRPETRYLNLIREYPDIVRRIEQRHIASYLGITPVHLSRIKKRLKINPAD